MKKWLAALALVVIATTPALSRDGWEGKSPLVCDPGVIRNQDRLENCQRWISTVSQQDNHISCCGDGDAYIADDFVTVGDKFYAIITEDYSGMVDENGDPPLVKKGQRILIPPNKLNRAQEQGGNPTGHGVVFLTNSGIVLCYFGPTLS